MLCLFKKKTDTLLSSLTHWAWGSRRRIQSGALTQNSYVEPAFLRSVDLMITLWLFFKHHISTQNEGKDFLATSIFQNFLRGWGHAGGHIGGMGSKGLGMLSSVEVANLLAYVAGV